MLSSLGIQITSPNQPSTLPPLAKKPPQNQSFLRNPGPNNFSTPKPIKVSSSSPSPTLGEEPISSEGARKEKRGVVVKAMGRSRLVLKFIWMSKGIGIAVDQVIPGGRGTIPLSPYYLWPRKDAWDELRVMLESKPWMSTRQKVALLNQATDVINFWQESGGGDFD